MNCIVIDKSPVQNNLVEYIRTVPYLELTSYCTSVFEAYEILQTVKTDLVFIDTDLPKVSGVDFIKSLDARPMVIFTSTNSNLAIEGYNLNALDFLLKPVSFDRFLKAANKAFEFHALKRSQPNGEFEGFTENSSNDFVLVKSDYQTVKINLEDIIYIEGLKDYIKIYTSQNPKPIITLNSLKKLQNNLPTTKFSRIHKSFIVGLKHINSINKTQVVINNKHIPIGESYKNIFMNKMEELKI